VKLDLPNDSVTLQVLEPHIALVTINRPAARNAVNGEVAAGLERAIMVTEQSNDIWTVILTGAGTQAICANAPIAVRESLQIARQSHDLIDAQLRTLSETAQDRVMRTEDFREGPKAFIEKRAPNWLGR
jgi:enoyl-CoA hydratase/carnithine racemase